VFFSSFSHNSWYLRAHMSWAVILQVMLLVWLKIWLLSSNYLAYNSVSSCNGSASSPQYTTCISPMMPSLDLPLLRLVIVAQSLQAFYEAQLFQ